MRLVMDDEGEKMLRHVAIAFALSVVALGMVTHTAQAHPGPGYTEEFYDPAFAGWTCNGLGISWDGGNGWTGSSMAIPLNGGYRPEGTCTRVVGRSLTTDPVLTFAWNAGEPSSGTSGFHADSKVEWYFTDGTFAHFRPDGGLSGTQPQLQVGAWTSFFMTPAGLPWAQTPNTWYRAEFTHNTAARDVTGKVFDANNILLASTSKVAYSATATDYQKIVVGGGISANVPTSNTFRYDSFYVFDAGRPTRPEAVTAQPGPSPGQVTINWSAPLGGLTPSAYHIYRGTTQEASTFIAMLYPPPAILTFIDTGLAEGSTWYYKVVADSAVGDGPFSRSVGATVWARPAAPGNLTATQGNNVGEIRLQWSVPSNGGAAITSYRIYRGTTNGGEQFLTQIAPTNSWTDQYLANGTRYYYKVSAVNAVGEGTQSNGANQLPKPDAVSGPNSLTVTPTRVWTGEPMTVAFNYTVTATQCPPSQTCPVDNEWRIYLDGASGTHEGTLLASGTRTHDGHAQPAPYTITQTVKPIAADGSHTLRVAVTARSGNNIWQFANQNIIIDAPLPGRITAGPAAPSLTPSTIWSGEVVQIGSSYSVFQKQCKSTLSCPMQNDWKLQLDGTTLITSGAHNHPAHGEIQLYPIAHLWSTPLLTPGAHTITASARADASSGWISNSTTLSVRGTTASTTGPSTLVVNPPYTFAGTVNATFEYSVTAQRCVRPVTCPVTNEWRILLDGGNQNGAMPLGTQPAGTIVHQGTFDHTAYGASENYLVARTVTIDILETGDHYITAAVRAIAGDGTYQWYTKTVKVSALSTEDPDGDGVPDMLEDQLCGVPVTHNIINSGQGAFGRCPDASDYTPPVHNLSLEVPHEATRGIDGDNDSFPPYVDVHFYKVTISVVSPEAVMTNNSGTSRVVVDGNDTDPNTPVMSIVHLPAPRIQGTGVSVDRDGDGFPGYFVVANEQMTLDRRRPTSPPTFTSGATWSVPLDPNDNDPNNPTVQTVVYEHPTWLDYDGRDEDNDTVLRGAYIIMTKFEYNRSKPSDGPRNITDRTIYQNIDPDDNKRDDPVPWSKVDADGDFVTDVAESWICTWLQNPNVDLDGSCNGTNYSPPPWYRRFLRPLSDGGFL